MATKDLKLVVEPRSNTGTTGAQALRAHGKIPAVIYGHGTAPEHVAIDAHVFEDLLHHGGRTGMITLTGGAGRAETALVREIQRHPVSHKVLHADLLRVSANESVHAERPIVTVGVPRGVKDSGGVMDVVTHTLDIEGPANQIPENIEVDVSDLGLNEHIVAGDIKLPAGFKLHTPADQTVVAIEASRTERDIEDATVTPLEVVEPEIVGTKDEE
jgi:large subunit ribosomal protein L25